MEIDCYCDHFAAAADDGDVGVSDEVFMCTLQNKNFTRRVKYNLSNSMSACVLITVEAHYYTYAEKYFSLIFISELFVRYNTLFYLGDRLIK